MGSAEFVFVSVLHEERKYLTLDCFVSDGPHHSSVEIDFRASTLGVITL